MQRTIITPAEYPFDSEIPNLKYDDEGYVEITPETAALWLKRNVSNRTLSERRVWWHRTNIVEGRWAHWNPNPISFSVNGRMIDGAQRLAGIVASGQTVRARVITGLPEEAQNIIDTGRSRSLSDILRMNGFPDPHNLAALVNRDYRWQTNQVRAVNEPAGPQVLLEMVQTNQERYFTALQVAGRVYAQFQGFPKSLIAHAWLLFSAVDPDGEDVAAFFHKLQTGLGLTDRDPIYALRRRRTGVKGQRIDDVTLIALMIKAWNYWRAGREIEFLAFRAGGADPEKIPTPR